MYMTLALTMDDLCARLGCLRAQRKYCTASSIGNPPRIAMEPEGVDGGGPWRHYMVRPAKAHREGDGRAWGQSLILGASACTSSHGDMVLDIMGNQWQLADGVLSIVAAGEGKARVVATPVTASSFACDFGGFVWIVAEGNL